MQKLRLGLAMPTYNRAATLDLFLSIHIPILQKYEVSLFISDNASTDNTIEIIQKWQKKFDKIHYQTKQETVPPDENVESALRLSRTEYTWLIGDSYEIPEATLQTVLNVLPLDNGHYDLIITNQVNKITNIKESIYTDHNEVLKDIGWLVTCLAVKIYHKTVLETAEYGKYFGTDFAHVGFMLDYIATRKFRLYWLQSASIVTLKTPVRKSGWGIYFFINIFQNWPNLIAKLPDTFTQESKLCVLKSFPQKSGLLGWRNLLSLRAQGFLTQQVLDQYDSNIDQVAPKGFRAYTRFLLVLPVWVCKIAISVIEYYRRIKFRLLKYFKPDAVA